VKALQRDIYLLWNSYAYSCDLWTVIDAVNRRAESLFNNSLEFAWSRVLYTVVWNYANSNEIWVTMSSISWRNYSLMVFDLGNVH